MTKQAKKTNLNMRDFLFFQFRSAVIRLTEIGREYYPELADRQLRERANRQEFPFPCFRLDQSNKAPYYVHIDDLAQALENIHRETAKDFHNLRS